MKVVVDKITNEIRGWYREPTRFSISGKYLIDIPDGISPESDVVLNLISDKIDLYKGQHATLINHFNDEFLSVPNIDTGSAESTRYMMGPYKRTTLLPGGSILTNVLSTTAGFSTTFFHLYTYLLYSEPNLSTPTPGPDKLLYNYDPAIGFIEFNPHLFEVEYWDDVGMAPLHSPVLIDQEDMTFTSPGALDFRIKIINNDPTRTFHVSDWLFLYD